MSVDLLALFNKPATPQPGAPKSQPAPVDPQAPPDIGPGVTTWTAGAYEIVVPSPTPDFNINGSGDGYRTTTVTGESSGQRFFDPDPADTADSTDYYFEQSVYFGLGSSTPVGPVPACPAPPTFYLHVSTLTSSKTTADVPLDEKLYRAFVKAMT